MKKLTTEDILSNDKYREVREKHRAEVIALKKNRRVDVGKRISLTFENRLTVLYQIQEMMRVEHITDSAKVQFELDVYNELVPPPGALSATLFIEVPDMNRIREVMDSFQGLDKSETLYMTVDGEKIFAEFEPGRSRKDRISAVHYIQFQVREELRHKFEQSQVEIHVRHPNYQAAAALTQEQKQEIAKDLH